jgi:hypothetical protein
MLLKQYTHRTQQIPFTTILTELRKEMNEERGEGRESALWHFIAELERWNWETLSPEQLEELWDEVIIWYDEG